MGRDQLTALKEKAGGSWRLRTFFTALQGSASRRKGLSLRMRTLDPLQSRLHEGRGLPGACALFLQHCGDCFAAALVWHLPESSRAGRGSW